MVGWLVGWLVGWSACWLLGYFALMIRFGRFNLQVNPFVKNEVEHDFFVGLSTSVILKFARPLPNLTRIGNPYDFANAS